MVSKEDVIQIDIDAPLPRIEAIRHDGPCSDGSIYLISSDRCKHAGIAISKNGGILTVYPKGNQVPADVLRNEGMTIYEVRSNGRGLAVVAALMGRFAI
jgi:hypothetical protein